jgi:hypothetical protein
VGELTAMTGGLHHMRVLTPRPPSAGPPRRMDFLLVLSMVPGSGGHQPSMGRSRLQTGRRIVALGETSMAPPPAANSAQALVEGFQPGWLRAYRSGRCPW